MIVYSSPNNTATTTIWDAADALIEWAASEATKKEDLENAREFTEQRPVWDRQKSQKPHTRKHFGFPTTRRIHQPSREQATVCRNRKGRLPV